MVNVRPHGTKRLVSLRRQTLDDRFPGFLAAITPSAVAAADRQQASGQGEPVAWD